MVGAYFKFILMLGYMAVVNADCVDSSPRDCSDPKALSIICRDPITAKFCSKSCKLCGSQGVTCLVCSRSVASPDACARRQTCQDTQICHTGIVFVDTAIRYEYGCIEKHTCQKYVENGIVSPFGRRQSSHELRICDACCSGNECNRIDCFQLQKNMTTPHP